MEIDDKLKKYIFKKLANDLSHVEIICYGDSVNFIDRDNNYWYMELKKNGHLWWRLDFFEPYLEPFGINHPRFSFIFGEFFNHYLKVNDFKSKEISKLCEADFVSEFEIDDILSDDRHLEIKMKQIIDEKRLDS